MGRQWTNSISLGRHVLAKPNVFLLSNWIAFVNRTDIYRRAIKRTFADLYSVSSDTVDVNWTTGKTIVVQCAGKTFLHPILSDPDDDAPEFT